MTVKTIRRKEMGFEQGYPPKRDEAPANPMQQQPMGMPQGNMPMEVPDHTHPEYDQMMVKLQELEGKLNGVEMGGVQQESLDEGRPETDKDKLSGSEKDPANVNQEKMIERITRKIVEELKGVPERDIGKDRQAPGPDSTSGIPQSVQPSAGTAPSGGGFDSDDKTNNEDGDKTVSAVTKPASEYPKQPIHKNRMAMAKVLIEQAKLLMREANEPDPSQPNPGATEQEPEKMDGSVPGNPMTGYEMASEDPEANVPNDQRPLLKEVGDIAVKTGDNTITSPAMSKSGIVDAGPKIDSGQEGILGAIRKLPIIGDKLEDDKEEDEDKMMERVYASLKKEISREVKTNRQSMVGMSAKMNSRPLQLSEDLSTSNQRTTNTIKEYLNKAGNHTALRMMIPN